MMMMPAAIRRAVLGALVGGLIAPLALIASVSLRPQLALEMDRDVRVVASGFYDPERADTLTFAWTRNEVIVRLPGLDRRRPWSCTIRLRGARPDPATLPEILVSVDGVTVVRQPAQNDWQDLHAALPARPEQPGVVIALTASNTFQPGGGDTRALGVMVDSWICRPESSGLVVPPRRALTAAVVGAAVFGAALGLAGLPALALFALLAVVVGAQSVALGWDFAAFAPYAARLPWTAGWIAVGLMAVSSGLDWIRRVPLTTAARVVIAISAVVLYVKLAALLHPSKLDIDVVFQAHRLEWVLTGRYFFTQTMPSGVQFPYAIALYVFAAPWTALTRDHVALLRIVVLTMEVTAGALLYPMIVRSWGDRVSAVMAVALFSIVPVSYWVLRDANLPNAFGQSIALIAVAAATVWLFPPRAYGQRVALLAITSVALLSHVSTFSLTIATLMAAAVWYWWRGGVSLRVPARVIAVTTILAAVIAVASYYANPQFWDVYKHATAATATSPASGAASFGSRIGSALVLSSKAIGWPMLLLAVAGAATLRRPRCDRLRLTLAAWATAYLAFLGVAVLTPVGGQFERYAAEFVGRVTYATYPAAVILAAAGLGYAWRRGPAGRVLAITVACWAAGVGIDNWLEWLR